MMNAASPSVSSKTAKCRQRILGLVAVLGLIAMAMLIELWIVTIKWTNIFHVSKNAQHFRIYAGGGHLIVFHISNWWTDTKPQFDGAREPPNLNLREWIGLDIESESRFAACYFAAGVYHPPLIDMTNVVITPHFQRGKSLRFRAWLFPIWIPCVACALPSVWWLVRRRRHASAEPPATNSRHADVETLPRPVSPS